MDLRKHILKNNACYLAGAKIKPQGGMLHSTGATNPRLARYVDAPELDNVSSNHWNQKYPGGRSVCVHGFIGLVNDGHVATYQTLPWDHRGWGGGGKSNDTHIHVEICEDDLKDPVYFEKVYKEAVELFAMLAEMFDWDPMKDIITHSEGYKMGIASNHADVMHWFPKHGKSMDTFRKDVANEMKNSGDDIKFEQPITPSVPSKPDPAPTKDKSIAQLAQEVIDGKHGTGDARKRILGSKYEAVQAKVNELLGAKSSSKPAAKSVSQLAQEVIDGKHGTGDARKKALGSQYSAVQAEVNRILGGGKSKPAAKSVSQLAQEVIDGKHGTGRERMLSLGSQYAAVQQEVNRLMRKR